MDSREVINRVISFDSPPRIGYDFISPHESDIAWIMSARLQNSAYAPYLLWGRHKELLEKVPGFTGEVCADCFGNIYGRYEGKTKGGCIKGVLQDGWDMPGSCRLPAYDPAYEDELRDAFRRNKGKYMLGALPIGIFSTVRDLRRIDNILMDLIAEEDMAARLLHMIGELASELIIKAAGIGFDGLIMYDDWGTQNALMISPSLWKKIFKPVYMKIINETHDRRMRFFLHSCGYIYDIIEDLIGIGVDVFQFDQPELMGVEKLSADFGGRTTFFCPVDIQRILAGGNKAPIQREAEKMIKCFGGYSGGFIAKDYPSLDDIGVKDEWAQWARDIFVSEGSYI